MSHDLMISLETTQNVLGWPSPDDVTDPQGAGASVFATLAREKIGSSLRQLTQAVKARVGVLMADPDTSTSEPPLAIVVEFDSEIGTEYIRELHRLSWNFSHSPTVITIEPNLLRVWSCCEAPNPEEDIERYLVETVTSVNLGVEKTDELEARAARALHWVNLASGHFFSENASRFDRNGRADQLLLNNLRSIREELQNNGLKNDDICHDLLARVIFVQFLFHRKDQEGNPALTAKKLVRLQKEGILTNRHSSLDSI